MITSHNLRLLSHRLFYTSEVHTFPALRLFACVLQNMSFCYHVLKSALAKAKQKVSTLAHSSGAYSLSWWGSHVSRQRKQDSRRPRGMSIKPQVPLPVTHCTCQFPTSQIFNNFPNQCHQLGTTCSNTCM